MRAFLGLLICAELCVATTYRLANPGPGAQFEFDTRPGAGAYLFSVQLGEGNFRVTLTIGDPKSACETTVRAEMRRLMVAPVRTAPGEFVTRTVIVNVRNSKLEDEAVQMGNGERNSFEWDDKLTLEFDGVNPCVASVDIEEAAVPTVYLAGDSTVTDQPKEPLMSWGQALPLFFTPDVAIANHAKSGDALKSFLRSGRLDKILTKLKKGDYVFIQFGHNDMKQNRPLIYAEAHTTYKQYLRAYIAEARLRGATAVLVTPMHRRQWSPDGKIVNTHGDYPEVVREVAREEGVALIDLHRMSAPFYEALGREKAPLAFGGDATHHSTYGAYELARLVTKGIREAGLDLARYIVPGAADIDPAHPDPVESVKIPPTLTIFDPRTAGEYTAEMGYGFEKPGTFSIHMPVEGTYRVTVALGDDKAEALTTVKAELRRLMLENVRTSAGEVVRRSFNVNIRTPKFGDGEEVRLKDREKKAEAPAWDDRLTLSFLGRPAVRSIAIERFDGPVLYMAGDSTSTDQSAEPFAGWGQMLPRFFRDSIAVANHGESGESARSFIGEKRWGKLMSVVKPGDWLLIQFGHNDQKDSAPGAGAFSSYKTFLKRFVAEARAKSVTPVLVTPMHRLSFGPDGRIANTLGDFPEAVRQVAREDGVPLVDLNSMSAALYEALGPEVKKAFAGDDTTHQSSFGAYELAKCVVEGLRKLDLAKHLIEGLPRFDPAHPDPVAEFKVPIEPGVTSNTPYGK